MPIFCARITKVPVWLTVAPVTGLPSVFSAGTGSPVIIDSSTLECPATTMPSTGTFEPGFTRSVSPTTTASSGTVCSEPSGFTRTAVCGASCSRSRIALDVRERARNSSTWPSSTSVTITADASK